jgi:hypothetical protein
MDLVEAAIIGTVIRGRTDEVNRNALIAAHIAQGHSIQSATMVVDQYISQPQQAPSTFEGLGFLLALAAALFAGFMALCFVLWGMDSLWGMVF